MAGIVELFPNDLPRAVERAGAASILGNTSSARFTDRQLCCHPMMSSATSSAFTRAGSRIGQRQQSVVFWESQRADIDRLKVKPSWLNRFSEYLRTRHSVYWSPTHCEGMYSIHSPCAVM